MEREQFETMLALQRTLRADAEALFQEYQKMHLEILGDRAEITFGLRHFSMATGEYVFDNETFIKELLYLPELPERDEWNDTPVPSLWDRMMEHSELHFKQFLGYECAHNYFSLPLAWLFDPAWKDKALAKLNKRAEQIRNANALQQEQKRLQDMAELQRLLAKYGEKS